MVSLPPPPAPGKIFAKTCSFQCMSILRNVRKFITYWVPLTNVGWKLVNAYSCSPSLGRIVIRHIPCDSSQVT
jgi:hypothetical protein